MEVIKTRKEFEEMKKEFIEKIDSFIGDYDKFTKSVRPGYWSTTGEYFAHLLSMKDMIPRLQPLELKDLESKFVRDEVLTDEEIDQWEQTKKYNL